MRFLRTFSSEKVLKPRTGVRTTSKRRFTIKLEILPRSKVFLEVSEPFSSEKGSEPRGSDWSEAT